MTKRGSGIFSTRLTNQSLVKGQLTWCNANQTLASKLMNKLHLMQPGLTHLQTLLTLPQLMFSTAISRKKK